VHDDNANQHTYDNDHSDHHRHNIHNGNHLSDHVNHAYHNAEHDPHDDADNDDVDDNHPIYHPKYHVDNVPYFNGDVYSHHNANLDAHNYVVVLSNHHADVDCVNNKNNDHHVNTQYDSHDLHLTNVIANILRHQFADINTHDNPNDVSHDYTND